MEIKEQIEKVRAEIKALEASIANWKVNEPDTHPAGESVTQGQLLLELERKREALHQLKRQHDQKMLSGMAKGGIQNDEMMSWWMNRY